MNGLKLSVLQYKNKISNINPVVTRIDYQQYMLLNLTSSEWCASIYYKCQNVKECSCIVLIKKNDCCTCVRTWALRPPTRHRSDFHNLSRTLAEVQPSTMGRRNILVLPENYLAVKLPGNFGEKASNVIIQSYVCIQPTISRGLTTIIYQTSLGDRGKKKTGAMTFTVLRLTVEQEHCVPACCVAFYTTRLQMCFIYLFQAFWL